MVTYPLNNIEYTAEDAELFHVTRTSGVYAKDSFNYTVTGADNTIVIGTGIGWIKNSEFSGKVIAQKESISIDMGLADSIYPRIDAVVIQFDANKNETTIVVKNGTAATTPVAPSVVRTETIYELHLYQVKREAGSVAITASAITDLRLNSEYCGIMADSVTNIDTDAIWQQIDAFIAEAQNDITKLVSDTSARLDTIYEETDQKYNDAQANIDELVSNTQQTLDKIVSDTDGKISAEITSQLNEAKNSGEFDGATFIPLVSENGDLSWSNDKGMENPDTINIMGPKGDKGDTGGAAGEAVTVTAASWAGDAAPFTATVASALATADNHLIVGAGGALTAEQQEAMAAAMIICTGQANGSITLSAFGDKPEIDLPVNIICVG